MKYVLITTTRDSVDVSVPAIAQAFLSSAQQLQQWQQQGIVDVVGLTSPFTPMKTLVVMNAADHNAVFDLIAQLPSLPYMNVSINPFVDWARVIAYLQSLNP